jgi:hypothetical protein
LVVARLALILSPRPKPPCNRLQGYENAIPLPIHRLQQAYHELTAHRRLLGTPLASPSQGVIAMIALS